MTVKMAVDYLNKYEGVAREILEGLLDKYATGGITNLEGTSVLKLNPFRKYGRPNKIIKDNFIDGDNFKETLKELRKELYA